jgi:hypothetical protein
MAVIFSFGPMLPMYRHQLLKMVVVGQEKQFSVSRLPGMSDVITKIRRLTVTVTEGVVNWPRQEQPKNQDQIVGVNFIVVPNRVRHSAISSSGWMTPALAEADLLKTPEEDRIKTRVLEEEDEEEDAVVGSLVIRHPLPKEERGNAETAVKKVG